MAYESMKKQNFGIEIELTGITREKAADVIARYFDTRSRHVGGSYDPYYTATDRKGRVWRAMTDGSIDTKRKCNGVLINANRDYSCSFFHPFTDSKGNVLLSNSQADLNQLPKPTHQVLPLLNRSHEKL